MNYMQIIEAFYPTYGVRCDGDEATYANIDWGSETPIVQATLDDKWLDMVKASKIEELSEACADDIVQGFSSDVLGADHWYASTMEDQTNIIGAALFNSDMPFKATPAGDVRQYIDHTAAQIQTVFQTGVGVKQLILNQYDTLKNQVLAAGSETAVNSIVYTSPRTGSQIPS
ncbi:MAG: hypothetical protein KAJ73_00400 [Zetaproteobacteria bacterium]|nr:hypothetical protein [Zetaproteobacteria bacterium]